ncbi:MAG: glycoside hydrolase family 97 N-terminal domain-containing protein, partial [Bacteroidales bacterium]
MKSLSSPDGKIKLEFSCSGCGIPFYKVSVDGKQFIDESELGISYNGSERTGHYIDKVSYRWDINEVWYQPLDENKENFSHFNEMTVVLQQDYLSYIKICFRVFNDGFAIKYEYDVKNAEKVILQDD